jgi:chemotaxis protein MotB
MKDQKIIIKRVKKVSRDGHHGGSWKVAYADFVTAMMAFFLLMWLITMVSPEKRARIADYFKHFSLFEQSGSSFLENTSEIMKETAGEAPKVPQELGNFGSDLMSKEDLKEKLKKEIEEKLAALKDQIMVDIFEGGVRIQVVDKDGNSMFERGSANLSPNAKKILSVIAENIRDLNNKVAIEGHTDAISYSSSKYTNWELSTDRASSARKELENNGLSPDRLARVAGYAATEPLVKDNPNDPKNRRISIILLYPSNKKENLNNR